MSKRSEVVFSIEGTKGQMVLLEGMLSALSDLGKDVDKELFAPSAKYGVWHEMIDFSSDSAESTFRFRWYCSSVKWDFEVERSFNDIVSFAERIGMSGFRAMSTEGTLDESQNRWFGECPPEDDVEFMVDESDDDDDDEADDTLHEFVINAWDASPDMSPDIRKNGRMESVAAETFGGGDAEGFVAAVFHGADVSGRDLDAGDESDAVALLTAVSSFGKDILSLVLSRVPKDCSVSFRDSLSASLLADEFVVKDREMTGMVEKSLLMLKSAPEDVPGRKNGVLL